MVPGPRRARLMAAVVGVVTLVATACGGGDSPQSASENLETSAAPEVENHASALNTRSGEGITAAGGTVSAGTPCPPAGSEPSAGTVTIAAVAPDLDRLAEVGLGSLVLDAWENIFESYINEVNRLGGINGSCFDFDFYEYGFSNPVEEIGAICTQLPQAQPLMMFGLAFEQVIPQCTTVAAGIPTIGLFSQFPAVVFAQAEGRMLVDHGSLEFLLDNGLRTGAGAGVIGPDDAIGLLYSDDESAPSVQATFDAATGELDLHVVATSGVPADLEGTPVVVIEERFRSSGGLVFDPDEAAFERAVPAMPPEFGQLLTAIRRYFIGAATSMRDAGVNTIVGTASWSSVRNLMRAAELIGWYPQWIMNDSHFPQIVLTDAPAAQAANSMQISTKRAAGDSVAGLDRNCLSLRNTGTAAEPFNHRHQTDAWILLTETCDYLDIVFAALSRLEGPPSRESLLAELVETDYRTAHGQRLRFAADDLFGSDSFRVLSADTDCVLNDWGCMRPLTDWIEPEISAGTGSGTG